MFGLGNVTSTSTFQYRDSSDILKTQNGFEYDSFSITQIKGSFKVFLVM